MAAQKGRSVLLAIGDGGGPEVFATIGGIRSATITLSNDIVDITTQTQAPLRTLLADTGLRSMSVSGSGIFEDDAPVNLVEDSAAAGTIVNWKITFGNGDSYTVAFQVASFEYGGEHLDAETFSITLEGSGAIAIVRA